MVDVEIDVKVSFQGSRTIYKVKGFENFVILSDWGEFCVCDTTDKKWKSFGAWRSFELAVEDLLNRI